MRPFRFSNSEVCLALVCHLFDLFAWPLLRDMFLLYIQWLHFVVICCGCADQSTPLGSLLLQVQGGYVCCIICGQILSPYNLLCRVIFVSFCCLILLLFLSCTFCVLIMEHIIFLFYSILLEFICIFSVMWCIVKHLIKFGPERHMLVLMSCSLLELWIVFSL